MIFRADNIHGIFVIYLDTVRKISESIVMQSTHGLQKPFIDIDSLCFLCAKAFIFALCEISSSCLVPSINGGMKGDFVTFLSHKPG